MKASSLVTRRRSLAIAVAVVAAVALAIGAMALLRHGSSAPATNSAGLQTELVARRTLDTRISVEGLLGYAGQQPVYNRLRGTVTAVRPPGDVIRPGQWLYKVDARPIVVFDGRTPAWRTLGAGAPPGVDVEELERALHALGFGPANTDQTFDSATTAAVSAWQRQAGLPVTGRVELGTVLFLPGPRRVASITTAVGQPVSVGARIAETSSTTRTVEISLTPEQRQYARGGAPVGVELPDGRTISGKIASISKAAVAHADAPPTTMVQIAVSGRDLPDTDAAPVSVEIVVEQARNALSVSVGALLALQGGGFGLELADQQRTILPVTVGQSADGFVAVSGPGLAVGRRVITTAA